MSQQKDTTSTFRISIEKLKKIKAIAYWERISIKDTLDAALGAYIAMHEKKHGEVAAVPDKRK